MIHISDALSIDGQIQNLSIASHSDLSIDAEGLTLFPGLIDPHVHFRVPGMDYKEDWRSASKAAIYGGYTTVFDMPNTIPPTCTVALLQQKKELIDAQLHEAGIPLRYQLFLGADKTHLREIAHAKEFAVGIKVFMGSSTGGLMMDDDESLQAVFELAAAHQLVVAVHAEDEKRLRDRQQQFKNSRDYSDHSKIRDAETARIAVEKAITLARRTLARLYITHVSTAEELALIRQAKREGLSVYAETTPHHLFLSTKDYAALQGKAVVNPPLRSPDIAVWEAITEGVIDTIGSDHAPHTEAEKAKPYGTCPSGVPGIETTLPLLLTAYHQGMISLQRIVQLTSSRAQEIFHLAHTEDAVLVDLNKKMLVMPERLKTKCAWSPFAGRELQGWPVYTIVQGQCFPLF